jgi:hypothetical protein
MIPMYASSIAVACLQPEKLIAETPSSKIASRSAGLTNLSSRMKFTTVAAMMYGFPNNSDKRALLLLIWLPEVEGAEELFALAPVIDGS